jgi:hypothetical protein
LNSFFEFRKGLPWIPVDENTFWLEKSVRMALRRPAPVAHPGSMAWREIEPGFEVAQLPAKVGNVEVDRIFLARIDPARYRFAVRSDLGRNLDDWMRELGAVLVVNGSYFTRSGGYATPVMVDGAAHGPREYRSTHGAFISAPDRTEIRDLAHGDWRTALRGSHTAMVSFPLLIAPDGTSRAPTGTAWLANRTFLGEDRAGRIVIGTTQGAFFPLDRLADFLKRSPLDLELALNLDGGPVACQGVALGSFRRSVYGRWELQIDDNGKAFLLATQGWRREPMPIVLAVFPRTEAGPAT